MFEGMRRNAKIVIYIVAFVFIAMMALGGITSIFNPKPYVGKIAGTKIHYSEYSQYLKNAYAARVQQNPEEEIDDKVAKEINDQTWNQLVDEILINKEIKRYRIKATDEDIIKRLQDPYDDIKAIPDFQTDSLFDYQKYNEVLLQNENFAAWYEMRIRTALPRELLFEEIKSEVQVSETEVEEDYFMKNNKADAKIIFFDPKKIKEFEVTDEEVEQYYEDNKEEFKLPPACKYKFVKMVIQPSDADNNLKKAKIDSLYKKVTSGEDFAAVAQEFSEGPSAPKGGDLGYFTRGRMVGEFEDVAFATNVGGISEPVLTQFGWHIITVIDKRKTESGEDEIRAAHILLKVEASDETKENIEIKAADLYEKAMEKGLEKAAEDFVYQVEETREFAEDANYIGGIGREESLIKFAFKNKIGKVAEVIKLQNGDFILAEISSKIGEHFQEFEEAKNKIKRDLENGKKLSIVTLKAEEFVEKFESKNYLSEASKEGWEIVEGEGITTDKFIPKIRKVEELNKAILEMKEKEFTELIKDENGVYLAYVEKREKPDMEKFEVEKEELMAEAQTTAENEHLNEWYKELKENAEIEDNRSAFF
ncbi:MAG: peptidylprolyl isomerase [Armatimonadetes bacterium]|nr:peptidylprolyl isomerase [Armatimonadota bacterium]